MIMTSSQDLEIEMMEKSDHLKTKSSLHSCSHCGKMLANRSNVLRHKKICKSNIRVSPPIVDAIYEQAAKIKRKVIDNKT